MKGIGTSRDVYLRLAIATRNVVLALHPAPLEVEKRLNRLQETDDSDDERVQGRAELVESVPRIE